MPRTRHPNSPKAMRACAARIPLQLYGHLQSEAERQGTTVGDIIRQACEKSREASSLEVSLARLESRLVRKIFEAQCAVVGLSVAERESALSELRTRLQGPRS